MRALDAGSTIGEIARKYHHQVSPHRWILGETSGAAWGSVSVIGRRGAGLPAVDDAGSASWNVRSASLAVFRGSSPASRLHWRRILCSKKIEQASAKGSLDDLLLHGHTRYNFVLI